MSEGRNLEPTGIVSHFAGVRHLQNPTKPKEASMNYLVTRLHKSGHTNIESILDLWRQLDKETESIKDIERFGSSIWKIWQTTDIFSTNIQNRIYSVNGHWEPMEMAAKTSSCYLFTKQDGLTTVFTILSTEKEAIGSVQSLIANIYHPVEQVNLERFFEQNKSLPVQAASIYEFEGNQLTAS